MKCEKYSALQTLGQHGDQNDVSSRSGEVSGCHRKELMVTTKVSFAVSSYS